MVVSVHVGRFLARFAGSLKAVASLPEDMRKKITTEDKGEVTVPVVVTDEVRRSVAFPTSFCCASNLPPVHVAVWTVTHSMRDGVGLGTQAKVGTCHRPSSVVSANCVFSTRFRNNRRLSPRTSQSLICCVTYFLLQTAPTQLDPLGLRSQPKRVPSPCFGLCCVYQRSVR